MHITLKRLVVGHPTFPSDRWAWCAWYGADYNDLTDVEVADTPGLALKQLLERKK